MSVILEALKKAQDERRKSNSRPTDADEFPPSRKMGRLYLLFGLALVLLATIFFVPDLRQVLLFDARTGKTPSEAQKSSSIATLTAHNNPAKPDAPVAAGAKGHETSQNQTGRSEQATVARQLPKVSWAPRIEVPVGRGKQGPQPTAIPSAPEPASPSSLDAKFQQSIIVRTTDVKDTAAQMYNSALGEMELGRHEEARRSYLAALADKPDDAEALNNLGLVRMEQGRTDDAIACFMKARELMPGNAAIETNLRIACEKRQKDKLGKGAI